ncbi:Conserved_hypothetical protein [Hexamita inflata]|uniref:Trichohyalin-plectin-homology domain-containing protein n=1 Tax=Hexamita inflata TaxID=28002 RepID=A0AA86UGQ0_9EUKA|nr:Conserved hypothetical protein [Hexamita inflata]
MPAMDTVFYQMNHKTKIDYKPTPTVISQAKLQQIQKRADPVECRTNNAAKLSTILNDQETRAELTGIERQKRQIGTENGNTEARIAHLMEHKQKFRDETMKLAAEYDQRQIDEALRNKKIQEQKIEDQSEYTRYLKTAKTAAIMAQYENDDKIAKEKARQQKIKEDRAFRQFVEEAAEKEKDYKKMVTQHFRENKAETAKHQELEMAKKEQQKLSKQQEVKQDLIDQKHVYQVHLQKEAEYQESLRKKQIETKNYYEEALAMEQEAKEQRKLEEKAMRLEEIETEKCKTDLFDYARQRQEEFIKRKVEYVQKQQDKAQESVIQARVAHEAALKSMELAAIDGERKKVQRDAWNNHWQQLNEDTYLVQDLQRAERLANQATTKMQSIVQGRRVIEIAQQEEEFKKQEKAKAIIVRDRLRNEMEAEQREREARIAREKKEIADFDRNDVAQKQAQFIAEQEKCRAAAMAEKDKNVKTAYLQVVKQMDKQATTVTWNTDIH